ncbi:hypothetical protein C0Q70_07458 [Pomacea canaliculata]|uniref:Uncharacterized protein n=1 Tax=Pomacea canaliculata TaxID=400727 RepID=A0A2T7PF36_POMCA|nr:hypothetical protein C0Q70_07458 [Pomacea canaliculata]
MYKSLLLVLPLSGTIKVGGRTSGIFTPARMLVANTNNSCYDDNNNDSTAWSPRRAAEIAAHGNKMAVQSADLLRKVFLERKRTGAKLQATQGC